MVEVADAPAFTAAGEAAEIAKSVAAKVKVDECVKDPLAPVTVIV